MGKNAIVGQSGGPTSVINASLAGVFESCKSRGADIVYGMCNGVAGLLEERVVDLSTLLTDEPSESEGGQKIFWSSDNEDVATVNKHGEVKAKADGTCTITATLADGRMSADVTVRVGAFTIPVYVTGNLQGLTEGEEVSLADIAALKAGSEDSILVDAGGSLQGTARASLTGGMDMTSAFGR